MTKKNVKIVVVVCLALAISTGAYAKSVYASSSVQSSDGPILPLTVEAPETILDWLENKGLDVENYSGDVTEMPSAYRTKLRDLYEDNEGELNAIAHKALTAYLEEGSVEYVTTSYGPITWTVEYDN